MDQHAARSIVASGHYGEFEGSPRDRVVMDEYRRLGHWAPELVTLIVERLFARGPGTFIDVGANIGLVCVPVIERTGAQAVCFEPEPENYGYLQRNVARHGLSQRIACHALACHGQSGQMRLALSQDNLGDHRLQPTAADSHVSGESDARHTILVPVEPLDSMLAGVPLPAPVVIKVDAQGSEVGVFDGAVETLERADFVISEYWPRGIVAHGNDADAFRAHMLRFPFGAVLHVLPLPEPLHSSAYVFEQLSWIKQDGTDPGFFDMLFSRHRTLPGVVTAASAD
jgi:FkbM family methyltransferase